MISAALKEGVIPKAIENGTIHLDAVSPRDFATDAHATVDDRPYGGGPGMILMADPLAQAVSHVRTQNNELTTRTVLLSPTGSRFDQSLASELADIEHLVLVSGRYEGIDERFINEHIDYELSIGDYVLSGGELPALVVIDTVSRLVPGALGNRLSIEHESFNNGLLDCPQYTRPQSYAERDVPEVLLSGDHKQINQWRRTQSLARTWERRPDLLLEHSWTEADLAWFEHHSMCNDS